MNQVTEEKKDSLTKTLAILGFIGMIILIVWLVVKIVALIPNAFSSLASIADSVYSPGEKELTVSTRNSVVNNGESFAVTWTKLPGDGTYSFIYTCTDGISVDIRKKTDGIETVSCNTATELSDATEMNMLINSEKQRFTDVEYAIVYRRPGAEDVVANAVITVVNPSIPTGTVIETTTEMDDDQISGTTGTTNTTGTTKGGTTSGSGYTNTGVTIPRSTGSMQYVYTKPQSDPNGHVDLQVTHLGVGTVTTNGFFTPLARIREDERGAVRFEIKNIGTKTADAWSYVATLPSDITYDAGPQRPLKPNERVTITLGFDGLTRTGLEQFGATVFATGDVNPANNGYNWVVEVVK